LGISVILRGGTTMRFDFSSARIIHQDGFRS
jgi:hypothetical protein